MINISIQTATAANIVEVRTKILRPGQWPVPEDYLEDNLADTVHFSAVRSDETLAVATFMFKTPPEELSHLDHTTSLQLRGMGVLPDARRQGVGAKLLLFATDYFEGMACDSITLLWFNARLVAIPFYESMGFVTVGDFFDVPNIGPHKVMWKLLERSI